MKTKPDVSTILMLACADDGLINCTNLYADWTTIRKNDIASSVVDWWSI
jgi:hypothetical protein